MPWHSFCLYVGSIHAAFNLEQLKEFGITHILNASGLPATFPRSFNYLSIELRDKSHANILGCIPAANIFIEAGLDQGGGVLVHCAGGRSRSAAFSMAFLMSTQGLGYDEAFLAVQRARPVVAVNLGFQLQLRAYAAARCDVHLAHQLILHKRIERFSELTAAPQAESRPSLVAGSKTDSLPSTSACNSEAATLAEAREHEGVENALKVLDRAPPESTTSRVRLRLSRPGSSAVQVIPPLRALERKVACTKCGHALFSYANVVRLGVDASALDLKAWVQNVVALRHQAVPSIEQEDGAAVFSPRATLAQQRGCEAVSKSDPTTAHPMPSEDMLDPGSSSASGSGMPKSASTPSILRLRQSIPQQQQSELDCVSPRTFGHSPSRQQIDRQAEGCAFAPILDPAISLRSSEGSLPWTGAGGSKRSLSSSPRMENMQLRDGPSPSVFSRHVAARSERPRTSAGERASLEGAMDAEPASRPLAQSKGSALPGLSLSLRFPTTHTSSHPSTTTPSPSTPLSGSAFAMPASKVTSTLSHNEPHGLPPISPHTRAGLPVSIAVAASRAQGRASFDAPVLNSHSDRDGSGNGGASIPIPSRPDQTGSSDMPCTPKVLAWSPSKSMWPSPSSSCASSAHPSPRAPNSSCVRHRALSMEKRQWLEHMQALETRGAGPGLSRSGSCQQPGNERGHGHFDIGVGDLDASAIGAPSIENEASDRVGRDRVSKVAEDDEQAQRLLHSQPLAPSLFDASEDPMQVENKFDTGTASTDPHSDFPEDKAFYLEYLPWMKGVAEAYSGTLHCPSCESAIGRWSWEQREAGKRWPVLAVMRRKVAALPTPADKASRESTPRQNSTDIFELEHDFEVQPGGPSGMAEYSNSAGHAHRSSQQTPSGSAACTGNFSFMNIPGSSQGK